MAVRANRSTSWRYPGGTRPASEQLQIARDGVHCIHRRRPDGKDLSEKPEIVNHQLEHMF